MSHWTKDPPIIQHLIFTHMKVVSVNFNVHTSVRKKDVKADLKILPLHVLVQIAVI